MKDYFCGFDSLETVCQSQQNFQLIFWQISALKLDFASRYFAKIKFVVILLQALRLLINLSCSDEMVAPLLAVSCTNGLQALLDPAAREEELLRYAYSYIYLPTIWY